jgi:hypothetical protein
MSGNKMQRISSKEVACELVKQTISKIHKITHQPHHLSIAHFGILQDDKKTVVDCFRIGFYCEKSDKELHEHIFVEIPEGSTDNFIKDVFLEMENILGMNQ